MVFRFGRGKAKTVGLNEKLSSTQSSAMGRKGSADTAETSRSDYRGQVKTSRSPVKEGQCLSNTQKTKLIPKSNTSVPVAVVRLQSESAVRSDVRKTVRMEVSREDRMVTQHRRLGGMQLDDEYVPTWDFGSDSDWDSDCEAQAPIAFRLFDSAPKEKDLGRQGQPSGQRLEI